MGEDGFKIGDSVEVEVIKISDFGAFVKLPDNRRGLIHISQVSDDFVKNINDYLKVGDKVTARIKKIAEDGKIDLTLKQKENSPAQNHNDKGFKASTFEEKMEAFLKKSALRQSDIRRHFESKGRGF